MRDKVTAKGFVVYGLAFVVFSLAAWGAWDLLIEIVDFLMGVRP